MGRNRSNIMIRMKTISRLEGVGTESSLRKQIYHNRSQTIPVISLSQHWQGLRKGLFILQREYIAELLALSGSTEKREVEFAK